jgi:DME family drug/metabolite transporter
METPRLTKGFLLVIFAAVQVDTTGIFLAFGAGFGYAVSLVGSKAVVADHSPILGIAVILCVGAVMVLPRLLLFENLSPVMTAHGTAVVLYLGLLVTHHKKSRFRNRR